VTDIMQMGIEVNLTNQNLANPLSHMGHTLELLIYQSVSRNRQHCTMAMNSKFLGLNTIVVIS
jgi:hypothetical protein